MALLELLVPDQRLRHDRAAHPRSCGSPVCTSDPNFSSMRSRTCACSRLPAADTMRLRSRVRVREICPQQIGVERLDGFARAENRTAQRVILPEALGEELVDEVVRRVLDHLDLFDDDLLLPLEILDAERRVADDVRQDVDGERQMLVEHLDVVARVFLGRERVELAADRIDRLRDVLRGSAGRALEEHVLDEVRDAAALGRFVARSARQPDADADRTDLRHPLSEKTKTVTENVSDDRRIRQGVDSQQERALIGSTGPEMRRKAFRESNLPTRCAF